jgi:hypothetical protein
MSLSLNDDIPDKVEVLPSFQTYDRRKANI